MPQLELLDQQSHDLYNLIQACQQAEDSLSQGMEKLQQTLADAVGRGQALGEGSYEMHKAIEKLEELVRLVIQVIYHALLSTKVCTLFLIPRSLNTNHKQLPKPFLLLKLCFLLLFVSCSKNGI